MEENMIKCEWCQEEMTATKTYTFFDHKTGKWHQGHKNCMNSYQFELEYPRVSS